MSRSDAERIADILNACHELEAIVTRGHEVFLTDLILQRAAERLLEIIGEAATKLNDESAATVIGVPWDDIRRLRIVVAHLYHRVDPKQVWTIISVDVPDLKRRLEIGS